MPASGGHFIPLYFATEYVPYTRRHMNERYITFGGTALSASAGGSVESAKKALKQAKATERKARKEQEARARAAKRAKKARRAALATFHELATGKDAYLRFEAAKQLKKWGTMGDCR